MKGGGTQPPKDYDNNTKDKAIFRMYIVQIIIKKKHEEENEERRSYINRKK